MGMPTPKLRALCPYLRVDAVGVCVCIPRPVFVFWDREDAMIHREHACVQSLLLRPLHGL